MSSKDDTNEGLPNLDPADPLYKLITKYPDPDDNPEGTTAREAIVGEVKISLPGKCTYDERYDSVIPFNGEFYPDTRKHPPRLRENVRSITGLPDIWWANFSRAVLCQSMRDNTSLQFHVDAVDDSVDKHNETLQQEDKLYTWYKYVVEEDFITYGGDFTQAKDDYIVNICTDDWVNYKMMLYDNGKWTDAKWECYHHWLKLSILGATDDEITTTIRTLRDMGLHIYTEIDENNWKKYMEYFDPLNINKKDVHDESVYHQQKTVTYFYFYYWKKHLEFFYPLNINKDDDVHDESVYHMHGMMKVQKESSFLCRDDINTTVQTFDVPQGLSINFCENVCPDFYISDSCLSGNTLVLMADGSMKPIKDVHIGESVLTTSGTRKVALVSMPPKGNRVMYRINGLDFAFTARHPFINSTSHQPYYMAISPLDALRMIPTLGNDGIGQISIGSQLLGFNQDKMATIPVDVTDVEEVTDVSGNNVYDLVLEPDDSGSFEYIVGSHKSLFVVASELPVYKDAPYSQLLTFSVIFHIISMAAPTLEEMYVKFGADKFKIKMMSILNELPWLMLASTAETGYHKKNLLSIKNKSDFIKYLSKAINAFTIDGSYNTAAGITFEHSMAILFHHLSSTINMGYRYVPLVVNDESSSILAVALLDVRVAGSCSPDVLCNMSIVINAGGVAVDLKLDDQMVKPGKYGTEINKVLYIPIESQLGDGDVFVSFEFKHGQEIKFKALTSVIHFPFSGLKHSKIILISSSNKAVGQCHIDMRCLSKEEMEKEKKEKSKCSEAQSLKIANDLCQRGATEFNKLLKSIN